MTFAGKFAEQLPATLRSVVELVDRCLVIGADGDALLAAREVVGDKLIAHDTPDGGDRAVARNAALEAAADAGAKWAVVLDAGEVIDAGGLDLRQALGEATEPLLRGVQADGCLTAERFFLLPVAGRYAGTLCETFDRAGIAVGTLGHVVFSVVPLPEATRRDHLEAEVRRLAARASDDPDEPRWYHHLGEALLALGRHEEAVAAWQICASLPGDAEQAAWAMYRAAVAWLALGDPPRAIEACAAGLARHAGLPELPWLAAYAALEEERHEQAVYWAQLAVALGRYVGLGAEVPRAGTQYPPAHWEGPFDVLRFALRALGDSAAADEAGRHWQRARQAREATQGGR